MAQLFEHTFQEALFGVGALLALAGAIFALANSQASIEGGFAEALSYGFTAFFLALFAGSLAGVGATMMVDALILGLRGNKAHVIAAVSFSLISLFVAASSVASPQLLDFHLFVLFFAGLSAAGAFMLSAAVFGFSALFHSFISQAAAKEGGAGQIRAAPSAAKRAPGIGQKRSQGS